MLRILLLFVLFSISLAGYAQDTLQVLDNYAPGVTQKYHVLKSSPNVKDGLYQAFFKRKTILASGPYRKGKRIGLWHFYNMSGKVIQHYNYNTNEPVFLAASELPADYMQYEFLPQPLNTDTLTLPIKIGGVLYGYLPYISKFKVKNDIEYSGEMHGILQILVSPSGRLAECILLVKAKVWKVNMWQTDTIETYQLNPELLDEYDKQFIPATVNHQKVSSTIYIYCQIQANGRLSIAQNFYD
jgi:hypothetical protein